MRPQEFIRLLIKAGFIRISQEGSHIRFRHPNRERDVIVPYHAGQEISTGLLHRLMKGWTEMKRSSLVVFEKTSTGWGAFALDFANTGGLGETLEEARQDLLDGIQYLLEDPAERMRAVYSGTCTNIDFSEFDPDHTGNYVIQWLSIEIPVTSETEVAA